MTTFDFPDTTLPSCQRDVTTVAPQALALLNNPFVHEQSKRMAATILRTTPDRGQQIQLAWKKALGRAPRPSETQAAVAHMDAQAKNLVGRPDAPQESLASLCHVLLNLNEFLYVD